jgi:glycosyltransferase involved in cell wall biosynthesis/SAM-dependent methyltransferase
VDLGGSTTVVITCSGRASGVLDSICSIRAQTVSPLEVVIADDGFDHELPSLAESQGVRLVRHGSQGLSASRNAAFAASSGRFVIFMEAGDRLLPRAIEAGSDVLAQRPLAACAWGRFRYRHGDCRRPAGLRGSLDNPYERLLEGMPELAGSATIYRRGSVEEVGRFDEALSPCADYDLCLRLARHSEVLGHDEVVAEQSDAGDADDLAIMAAVLAALEKQRPSLKTNTEKRAYDRGRRHWIRRSTPGVLRNVRAAAASRRIRPALGIAVRFCNVAGIDGVSAAVKWVSARRAPAAVNGIRWGSLRRLQPISSEWGAERGQPVDRYYIWAFLQEFAQDVHGRVLEVGNDTYTRMLSHGRSCDIDVLHVDDSNPQATIVADLQRADHIPSESFDCIIIAQTLHLIYDMESAVRTLHRILKPGGVLLLTVPGITPVSSDRWSSSWFWSFTESSARRLVESVFARDVVTYTAGNVLAAAGFLYGVAASELTTEELDAVDSRYPVTIGVRAMK